MNELSFLDSIFNDVMGTDCAPVLYHSGFSTPKVDVKENKNAYTLEMELPGRTEKDVDIELDHDNLTIASVKEEKKEEKKDNKEEGKYILKERRTSSFTRRFTLPSDVDAESINASFKNGVLTISMKKKALAEPKRIAIEAC